MIDEYQVIDSARRNNINAIDSWIDSVFTCLRSCLPSKKWPSLLFCDIK